MELLFTVFIIGALVQVFIPHVMPWTFFNPSYFYNIQVNNTLIVLSKFFHKTKNVDIQKIKRISLLPWYQRFFVGGITSNLGIRIETDDSSYYILKNPWSTFLRPVLNPELISQLQTLNPSIQISEDLTSYVKTKSLADFYINSSQSKRGFFLLLAIIIILILASFFGKSR